MSDINEPPFAFFCAWSQHDTQQESVAGVIVFLKLIGVPGQAKSVLAGIPEPVKGWGPGLLPVEVNAFEFSSHERHATSGPVRSLRL